MSGGGELLDWVASAGTSLRGVLEIPGDKSVSHRSVMFAALADGLSTIDGFLEGEDTRATAAIFSRLGVRIETPSPSRRIVHGVGIDGLHAADGALDCGNAGTGMRLLAGLLAAQRFDSVLVATLQQVLTICTESAADCRKRMGTRVGNIMTVVRYALARVPK